MQMVKTTVIKGGLTILAMWQLLRGSFLGIRGLFLRMRGIFKLFEAF
jgi:hypothetical protein